MKQLKTAILNLLFPVNCGVCNGEVDINNKYGVCRKCRENIEIINSRGCKYCGKPVNTDDMFCDLCKGKKSKIDKINTVCYYKDNIKILIKNFKFNNRQYLGKILGELVLNLYKLRLKDEKIDLILGVPLSSIRKKTRGYNQAEILVKYLSKKTGISTGKKLLIRTHDTNPQYTLSRIERFKNIRGAFKASEKVARKNILLIDDIATTGATLQSCAEALKKANAENIYAMVIAHGK